MAVTGVHGNGKGGVTVGTPAPTKPKDTVKWAYYKNRGWFRVGSPRAKLLTKNGMHPVGYGLNDGTHKPRYTYNNKGQKVGGQFKNPNAGGNSPSRDNYGPPPSKTGQRTKTNPTPKPTPKTGANGSGGGTPPATKPKSPPKSKSKQGQTYNKLLGMLGNPNTGQKLSSSLADQIAGLQFDPQIADTNQQIKQTGANNAQALADINNWYAKIQQQNTAAGQANATSNQQIAATQSASDQALGSIAGGASNAAGTQLAAQSSANEALTHLLAATDSMYHSNETPILSQAAAGSAAAQQASGNAALSALQSTLSSLQGQRGQAKGAAMEQIIQQNNALAQQRFSNSLAKQQAAAGIQQLIGNNALMHLKIQSQKLSNKTQQQQTAAATGFTPWVKLTAPQRVSVIQNAIFSPNGTKRPLGKARAILLGLGYGGPNRDPGIDHMLGGYYNTVTG